MTEADLQVRALVAQAQLQRGTRWKDRPVPVHGVVTCPWCRVASMRWMLRVCAQYRKGRARGRGAARGREEHARYGYLECTCGYAGLHWYGTHGSLPGWRPTARHTYYEDRPCVEGRLGEGWHGA